MKALKFLMLVLLAMFMVTSCQNDKVAFTDEPVTLRKPDVPKMVPIKGKGISTHVLDDFVPCTLFPPDDGQIVNAVPRIVMNEGVVSHLGELDPDLSYSEVTNCYNKPAEFYAELEVISYAVNLEGDGIIFQGTSYYYGPPPVTGYGEFTVIGGYGKFENASGYGTLTFPTNTEFTFEGMITQPNH